MDWTPTIAERPGPLYLRIVNAIADDIAAGRLRGGQPLPTHRLLARSLGVDLTTVTRAYKEAQRQGLTEARVGRGTFVKAGASAPPRSAASPGIDLTMNLPPQPPEADVEGRLVRAIAEVRAQSGLSAYLNYYQPGGSAGERALAAEWLRFLVPDLTADRLIIAPGTQNALLCLLFALTSPGDSILTEALTYPGLKAAAAVARVTLIGVDMDAEGINPKALDQACRQHGPKAVYLMPTMHNPTTATMSPERRVRVARVIKKHELPIIEDDPYAFLAPGITPLASLVPEYTYLAASLSKCIAPGLRVSLLVVPDKAAAARIMGLLRATAQMSVPLTVAIVAQWMRDGSAAAIIEAVAAESAARQALAREALKGHDYAAHPGGHHIWLPVPEGSSDAQFAGQLQRRGLAVVTGEAFATTGAPPNAIRVALGAARNRSQLAKALEILGEALSSGPPDEQVV